VTVLAWQPVDGAAPGAATHTLSLDLPVGAAPGGGSVDAGGARADRVFTVRHRVHEHAGNAWTAWQEMGRPASPGLRRLDVLHEASRPAVEHGSLSAAAGRVRLDLTLERHEVTLVELEPVRDETPPWLDDSRIPGYGRTAR
jgi:xylan 1,4-beta-xylosidase